MPRGTITLARFMELSFEFDDALQLPGMGYATKGNNMVEHLDVMSTPL